MGPTNRVKRRRGQGMTEYIVIVGLIAVLLIPVIARFSGILGKTIAKSTGAIDGHVTKKIGGGGGSSSSSSGGGTDSGTTDVSSAPIPHNTGH